MRGLGGAFAKSPVNVLFEPSGPQHVILTKETAEEIDKQLQKMKIAKRKNQPEKLKKIAKKLARLRAGTSSGSSSTVDDTSDAR